MASSRSDRPLRADARRNVDKLIAQAAEDFTVHGADVSLDDIAKRAGVGSATLFRHFPSRDALLAEVIRASIEALHAESDCLAAAADPDTALQEWSMSAIAHAARYRGLADSLMTSYYDPGSPLHASCSAMHASGAKLLERSQRAGSARPDVTGHDLFTMIAATAWATERHDTQTHEDLRAILLAGLFRPAPREDREPASDQASTTS